MAKSKPTETKPTEGKREAPASAPRVARVPAAAETSPAIAMGDLYLATSQALANAAHNATNQQQQINITGQAAMTQGIESLYGIDAATTGEVLTEILHRGKK